MEQAGYEKQLAALREKIEQVEFKSAWEEGQKLKIGQAITIAVQEN